MREDDGTLMARWLAAASRLAQTPPGTPEHSAAIEEVTRAREAYERAIGRPATQWTDEQVPREPGDAGRGDDGSGGVSDS